MSILNNFIPVANPDGTISYFPSTLESEPGIPFRSMVDMAEDINYFSPTNTSPNIIDEARELNEALKRRRLFSTNFQDPYYLNTGVMSQAPLKSLGFDTSFGVANEPDDEEDVDKATETRSGIAKLFEFLQGIPTPFNLIRGGLESLSGLNQRIQQSDFGRSKNLMDFLDMRKYGGFEGRERARRRTMTEARDLQRAIDRGDFNRDRSGITDRGRGDRSSAPSRPSRSAPSYEEAGRSFARGR